MANAAPTDRELQLLKIVWRKQEATVRDVWRELTTVEGELAYTTVLSLMQVMEQKGYVGHRVDGKTYVYFPRAERRSVFQHLAAGFLERVFDGAVDEYFVHALDSRHHSNEELDRLEKMIVAAKARARRRQNKGDKQ